MKSILMFIGGIVVGAGASWVYHKNKYEQMVQDEVESLREHMKNGKSTNTEPTEFEAKDENEEIKQAKEYYDNNLAEEEYDESMARVHNLVRENHYTSSNDKEENMANKYKKPFVVTPDDFASVPGFDTDTFYYHQDDIISNGDNEMLGEHEVEQILGLSVLQIKEQFGVYEEDSVYIRNMRMKCDYEILREEENFTRRNGD
jgi:hypothetical protein